MVLRTKEENRTNAQDKPLRLRAELVHLFPLVVQKLSSLIITEFTKYKSNSLSKGNKKRLARARPVTLVEGIALITIHKKNSYKGRSYCKSFRKSKIRLLS